MIPKVLLLSLVAVHAAVAQQPAATLTITPDSLIVAPGHEGRAFVVVGNSSETALTGLRLSVLADDAVRVRFARRRLGPVPPGGSAATTLFISGVPGTRRPDAIIIRADYRLGPAGAGILLARVRLLADPLESVAAVAEGRLSASAGTLTAREPGRIHLLVTNKTDLPIEVRRVTAQGVQFAKVTIARGKLFVDIDSMSPVTILPRRVEAFVLELRPLNRVRPGKYGVVFDVELGWTTTSGQRVGNLVVPHEMDVGVFGESAALKLLSVPSFLLLPGFLMVVAYSLARQFENSRRGAKATESSLKVSSPEFWVVAISLSALMALLYPRDYIDSYGTMDLVQVWLVSVLVGALAGFIRSAWIYGWSRPSAKDSPITILRKLDRQRLGLDLEVVELDGGDRRFLLQPRPQEDRPVWVGPTMVIEWHPGAPPEDHRRFDELRQRRDPGSLADFLKHAEARDALRVVWSPPASVPAQVAKGKFVGRELIVEQQEG